MQHSAEPAQIDRAFVRIAEGQVHYRTAGPAKTAQPAPLPLWMIHASPASSSSLVGLVGQLGLSRRVIAPDTLGNGDSAPPAEHAPQMPYYAATALRTMDALGIDKVDLYGSHTGAHVAFEMAIAAPQRVGRMILDGVGMFSPEETQDMLANYAPAIEPDFFGNQFNWAWHFVRDQGWFFPYFKRDQAHLRGLDAPSPEVLHTITVEVLKSIRTYHLAYRAAFAHDDYARLPLVQTHTLVMADESDPLKKGVEDAARLLPSAVKRYLDVDWTPAGQAYKAGVIARFFDGA